MDIGDLFTLAEVVFLDAPFVSMLYTKIPTVRLRSVDRVIAEIKDMLSACKHIKVLFFEDEIFPVRTSFFKRVLREI